MTSIVSRNDPTNSKGRSSLSTPGRGCGLEKNRAVEQSRGEYLCFLDADDVMQVERIEQQVSSTCLQQRDSKGNSCINLVPRNFLLYSSRQH